ncbi:gluconolactonase [Rosenbergiella australiborealis]|uniref:Gluconolactonase n=1 Tax=Rosenbergiella australiborealis TaxID=1544696 RepID=A0ABS5T651_9GAMM|nr:gluconolactonase [Rosenbergiella australiborealis]
MKLFSLITAVIIAAITPEISQAASEVIAKIEAPYPDISGIAVNHENRVFLGFPRHSDNHNQPALMELVQGRLNPYPNSTFGIPHKGSDTDWLVSPHGMFIDKHDVLWVLDDGKIQGESDIPLGAAKVVAINTQTNCIIKTLLIKPPILNNSSHYNDLRIDLSHGKEGTLYIANSGFKQRYSLIVIDVASNQQREVLVNQPSTSPDPGFMAFIENKPVVFNPNNPKLPQGGVDGVALSPDSRTFYWTVLSGRNLYSLPTALLSNFSIPEATLEKAVKFEGEHPANDGMAEDEKGNLYFGAYEQQSLVKRDKNGQFYLLDHDVRNLGWPDGLAYRNGYLYTTLGQWNRTADLNNNHDLRQRPFLVIRTAVE